jgi:hypothetical protein
LSYICNGTKLVENRKFSYTKIKLIDGIKTLRRLIQSIVDVWGVAIELLLRQVLLQPNFWAQVCYSQVTKYIQVLKDVTHAENVCINY